MQVWLYSYTHTFISYAQQKHMPVVDRVHFVNFKLGTLDPGKWIIREQMDFVALPFIYFLHVHGGVYSAIFDHRIRSYRERLPDCGILIGSFVWAM